MQLTIDEYLAHPAINRSKLLDVLRNPAYYHWKHLSGEAEEEDTKALKIGTAFHTLILEPELFDSTVAILPDDKKRPTKAQLKVPVEKRTDSTRIQIEWWEKFDEAAGNKAQLKNEEVRELQLMATAIRRSPATQLLDGRGKIEETLFWVDEETGLEMKYRADFILQDGKAILDVKTVADAAPDAFARSVINYGYDVQAYMAFEAARHNGLDLKAFGFACVEKKAPFGVGLYSHTDDILMSGKKAYRAALTTLKECMDSNVWPSYTSKFTPLYLPHWHMSKVLGTYE